MKRIYYERHLSGEGWEIIVTAWKPEGFEICDGIPSLIHLRVQRFDEPPTVNHWNVEENATESAIIRKAIQMFDVTVAEQTNA